MVFHKNYSKIKTVSDIKLQFAQCTINQLQIKNIIFVASFHLHIHSREILFADAKSQLMYSPKSTNRLSPSHTVRLSDTDSQIIVGQGHGLQ